jgi:hypothetical protein
MAGLQEYNPHSWRQSAVFYYDVMSIELNSEISILAWTDTSTGNFNH